MTDETTKTLIPGWAWPVIIVGMLALNVAVCAITVVSALSGDTGAEPDYYEKALAWDAYKAEFAEAEQLGWSIETSAHHGMIDVSIRDRAGRPVDAVSASGVIFHQAHADRRRQLEFDRVGDGRFMVHADLARPGLWELRLEIKTADTKVGVVRQIEVPETED